MSQKATPTPMIDLEEAAEGHQLFKTPGSEQQMEQARDQAEAAGWLEPDVVYDWPSPDEQRRIVDRRRDLYDVMRRLEMSAALPTGREDWAEEVGAALTDLGRELERHVAEIEGPRGLFADVMDRTPHLAAYVDSLRADHVEIADACRMAREALAEEVPAHEIRRRVIAILGRLVIHRQEGAELLFDSYNVDLSAGD